MKTSIIIPTKNAGQEFKEVLKSIFQQSEKNFELIVIDSGSHDETIKIAKSFPTKIYKIKSEDFGHGKTRNLSLKYAKGKYIVFLSQDAKPLNNKWLSNLLKNFKDKKVAGIFSKQIPRKDAPITERFFYNYYFHNTKTTRPKSKNNNFLDKIFFSNVSSAIKKDILKKHAFNENLIMSEDQQWAKDILGNGFKTLYEPTSIVIHSHNYNLKTLFQRYFDSALSLKQITNKEFKDFSKTGSRYMKKEFQHIVKEKPLNIPYHCLYNTSKILGTTLGLNSKYLHLQLKKTFSLHKKYWINH